MNEKKLTKTAVKAKVAEQESAIVSSDAEPAVKSVENPLSGIVKRRNLTKAMPMVCVVCAFVVLLADNVYLHVETRRQERVLQSQAAQIDGLCEWVEHSSIQGKWNDGKNSVKDFGHRVAERIRAAGRKTVSAFHKVDDKLNPQTGE